MCLGHSAIRLILWFRLDRELKFQVDDYEGG